MRDTDSMLSVLLLLLLLFSCCWMGSEEAVSTKTSSLSSSSCLSLCGSSDGSYNCASVSGGANLTWPGGKCWGEDADHVGKKRPTCSSGDFPKLLTLPHPVQIKAKRITPNLVEVRFKSCISNVKNCL